MIFDLPTILFYMFSAVTIFAATMVISGKNPVHSVLFLILAFFNAAGLMVLLGAEYIAMTLVIVYVGAVAVLFLFVVMMLNVNFVELRQGFLKYLPVGIAVAVLVFVELIVVFFAAFAQSPERTTAALPMPSPDVMANTQALGHILYTEYVYAFQMSGLILLVAMIGAIVLTLRHRPDARRQKISEQVFRTREESIMIVKVKPGEGA